MKIEMQACVFIKSPAAGKECCLFVLHLHNTKGKDTADSYSPCVVIGVTHACKEEESNGDCSTKSVGKEESFVHRGIGLHVLHVGF